MDRLVRPGQEHRADSVLVYFAMRLGVEHGWQPAGTGPPPDWNNETWESWDDADYWSGLGQWVTDEDAREWASALRHALDDIPDENLMLYRASYLTFGSTGFESPMKRAERMKKIPLAEVFSGDGKKWLTTLIEFLEHGGFRLFWGN